MLRGCGDLHQVVGYLGSGLAIGLVLGPTGAVWGQITPNGLGTAVQQDGNVINISGGKRAGRNLFHSFGQFNVRLNETANFLSNPSILNILGRINGGSVSQIEGTIRVSGGPSNLYLLNPSGIVFGPNARLDVPAAFVATTARAVQFGNGVFGMDTEDVSSLQGNPLALMNFGEGSIEVKGASLSAPGGIGLVSGRGGLLTEGARLETSGGLILIGKADGFVEIRSKDSLLGLEVRKEELRKATSIYQLPELLTGDGKLTVRDTYLGGGQVKVAGDQVDLVGSQVGATGDSSVYIDSSRDLRVSGSTLESGSGDVRLTGGQGIHLDTNSVVKTGKGRISIENFAGDKGITLDGLVFSEGGKIEFLGTDFVKVNQRVHNPDGVTHLAAREVHIQGVVDGTGQGSVVRLVGQDAVQVSDAGEIRGGSKGSEVLFDTKQLILGKDAVIETEGGAIKGRLLEIEGNGATIQTHGGDFVINEVFAAANSEFPDGLRINHLNIAVDEGTIRLRGKGFAGSSIGAVGVYIQDSQLSGKTIQIDGKGGSGTGGDFQGVFVEGSQLLGEIVDLKGEGGKQVRGFGDVRAQGIYLSQTELVGEGENSILQLSGKGSYDLAGTQVTAQGLLLNDSVIQGYRFGILEGTGGRELGGIAVEGQGVAFRDSQLLENGEVFVRGKGMRWTSSSSGFGQGVSLDSSEFFGNELVHIHGQGGENLKGLVLHGEGVVLDGVVLDDNKMVSLSGHGGKKVAGTMSYISGVVVSDSMLNDNQFVNVSGVGGIQENGRTFNRWGVIGVGSLDGKDNRYVLSQGLVVNDQGVFSLKAQSKEQPIQPQPYDGVREGPQGVVVDAQGVVVKNAQFVNSGRVIVKGEGGNSSKGVTQGVLLEDTQVSGAEMVMVNGRGGNGVQAQGVLLTNSELTADMISLDGQGGVRGGNTTGVFVEDSKLVSQRSLDVQGRATNDLSYDYFLNGSVEASALKLKGLSKHKAFLGGNVKATDITIDDTKGSNVVVGGSVESNNIFVNRAHFEDTPQASIQAKQLTVSGGGSVDVSRGHHQIEQIQHNKPVLGENLERSSSAGTSHLSDFSPKRMFLMNRSYVLSPRFRFYK